VPSLGFGTPGAIVLAPGDTRGTVLVPERYAGHCCGWDGGAGPNLACERCGREVATRVDDCSLWQAVWFEPGAVRDLAADGPGDPRPDWRAALAASRWDVAPADQSGHWSPQWAAAVGSGLAYLLAASEGGPVTVPPGPVADLFGPALDALLPATGPVRTAAPAGPGLPAPEPAPDIPLVPRHPRTGVPWRPGGTARTVPLPAGAWAHLALPGERRPVPVSGGLPGAVLGDDPPPMRPRSLFRPDERVFLATLARLPAVREPWLREIYERVRSRPSAHPF
jgi:hypothetical protein